MPETAKRTRPAVYTIPAHVPFADALAGKLLAETDADPLALARTRIFVPNRRAARTVADAFLRASGGGILLPRLQPLGDLDALDDISILAADIEAELPPAVGNNERLFALAPLIRRWGEVTRGRTFSAAEVLKYARALVHQIDQFDYAAVDGAALRALAPEEYAAHWQEIIRFLDIILVAAPQAWTEQGKIGPAARRVQSLTLLAQAWTKNPPQEKIIVAGSTGTIPAVAGLMRVIARLPHGAVILPSLDRQMDEDHWQKLTPSHAQFALKQLLDKMDVGRSDVDDWWPEAPASAAAARSDFINMALWPAAKTSQWRQTKLPEEAWHNIQFLEAATDIEEARAIALHVRDQLQSPEKTIAIVTADRALAQRIAAALGRFDIALDDSAGVPLLQTPPAVFLRLLAQAAKSELRPVDLLALLKHPLCTAGLARHEALELVRLLDRHVLRGLRPAPGFAGLKQAIATNLAKPETEKLRHRLLAFADMLEKQAGNFLAHVASADRHALQMLHAHVAAAEALATTAEEAGAQRLWQGEAGQALAQTVQELVDALPADFTLAAAEYALWFEEVLAGHVVRPRFGKHPRVDLLSPIEARLQRADVMILAGLNEGSWPPAPQVDPFLGDNLRDRLNRLQNASLPTSEFRLGQSAHDFLQCLGAATVLLTRAQKSAGTPTLPSRFWQRLQALGGAKLAQADHLLVLARALDQAPAKPAPEPRPIPPLEARPQRISISDMSLWRQNPYAFYAKKILGLYPLEDIDVEPGALERGTVVHKALELFFNRPHPARTLANLLADGQAAFAEYLARPLVRAFWWPRFQTLAHALIANETLMADATTKILIEVTGGWQVPGVKRELLITGKADRVDIAADGTAYIYDYKSGSIPSTAQIKYARLPQMALLALMAENGSFSGGRPLLPEKLAYVLIKGQLPEPLAISDVKMQDSEDIAGLMAKTAAILERWVGIFEKPDQPYKFLQSPERGPGHEYDLLARVDEWRGRDI